MAIRLIIDGNAVYEIDEECLECRKNRKGNRKKENTDQAAGNRTEKKHDDTGSR